MEVFKSRYVRKGALLVLACFLLITVIALFASGDELEPGQYSPSELRAMASKIEAEGEMILDFGEYTEIRVVDADKDYYYLKEEYKNPWIAACEETQHYYSDDSDRPAYTEVSLHNMAYMDGVSTSDVNDYIECNGDIPGGPYQDTEAIRKLRDIFDSIDVYNGGYVVLHAGEDVALFRLYEGNRVEVYE